MVGNRNSSDASSSLLLISPSPSAPDDLSQTLSWDVGPDGVDVDGLPHEFENPTALFPGCVAVSQPLPLPAVNQNIPTSTPLQETQPELNSNFAANAVPTRNLSPPSPSVTKLSRHNLRLPSFDLLGIGSPHPDRIGLQRSADSFLNLGSGPLSNPDDPLHVLSPNQSPSLLGMLHDLDQPAMPSPHESKPHDQPFIISTVTPPAEPGTFHWGPFLNIRTAGMSSPPNTDPGISPDVVAVTTPPSLGAPAIPLPVIQSSNEGPWTEKVLSHALPCPSRAGHVFPTIIDAIHRQTPCYSTAWINVFHAVPGRFTLAELPTSPPTTPGPAVGGDEYFTSKVFDSAVQVSDYQGDSKLIPPSPRPVVAPGSVDVSVVERYIPPTNLHEFAEMFAIKGRSLLVDRMVELSVNHGTLLFIYPTKTGARTFMREYLGPILDPFLRTLAVVHNLPSDLCSSLGRMVSVERLVEFDILKQALERFCDQISYCELGKFQNEHCKYSLVYSAKEELKLDRDVWATDWWIKQEKPRVRDVVTKYTRPRRDIPAESDATPTNLIQEILESVAKKEYEDGGPTKGVEVGIFIIRKSG
ncbi:hypothetical protein GQ43DRAFT_364861 [Delitschia confertaspora ATCC 74209]|uniref:Uncharacterized protein n=1 Tax=Delitschia confertaspora ATCC 74209 TaxID=1513339 RepID=A0A9P4JXH4_9PLEO|nr:hypothetical protein GQ43DRAFT_364861 [Delitschia confertaspora ATCC 74209]